MRAEDNIKLDLRDIGIDGAKLIQLAQDRVQWRAFVSTVESGVSCLTRKFVNDKPDFEFLG
jgi:hypothetical protein